MKISKLAFDGTSAEFEKIAHLFADSQARESASTPKEESVGGVEKEFVLRILSRLPLSDNQKRVLQIIHETGDQYIGYSELAKGIKIEPSMLAGVLGTLGRRIKNTPGFPETEESPITLFFEYKYENGEWHYRMCPLLREVVEETGIV